MLNRDLSGTGFRARTEFQKATKWIIDDLPHREDKGHTKMGLHPTADELQARIGQKMWRRLTKFAVVREPYDRVLSLWRAAQIGPNNQTGVPLHPELGFEEFVLEGLLGGEWDPTLTLPQWAFVQRQRNLGVDHLFRFEDGLSPVREFLEDHLWRKVRMPHLWGFKQDGDEQRYTPKLRDAVRTVFADDFTHLYPDA